MCITKNRVTVCKQNISHGSKLCNLLAIWIRDIIVYSQFAHTMVIKFLFGFVILLYFHWLPM